MCPSIKYSTTEMFDPEKTQLIDATSSEDDEEEKKADVTKTE